MTIINFFAFALGFLITYIALPYFISMLISGESLERNYLNHEIPTCVGIIFVIVQALICILLSFFYLKLKNTLLLYCVFMILIALVSLLDDLAGEKKIKGLKGHLLSLLNMKLTSGGLKALTGLTSSVIISINLSENIQSYIVNVLLFGLFSNFINMFDLRPGRGLKVFVLLSLITFFAAVIRDMDFIIFSALGIAFAYLPDDVKGLSMMGDIGANFLGMTLGFYSVVSQNYTNKIILLIFLILIHIVGEFTSLTRIIEKNRVLSYLDNLGR